MYLLYMISQPRCEFLSCRQIFQIQLSARIKARFFNLSNVNTSIASTAVTLVVSAQFVVDSRLPDNLRREAVCAACPVMSCDGRSQPSRTSQRGGGGGFAAPRAVRAGGVPVGVSRAPRGVPGAGAVRLHPRRAVGSRTVSLSSTSLSSS